MKSLAIVAPVVAIVLAAWVWWGWRIEPENGQIAVMRLTKKDFTDCSALSEHADTIVNFGLDTAGTRMAVLAREADNGTIKFSLRAKEPDSVNDIAQSFGGGGHPQAAGITMAGTLEESVRHVLDSMIRKVNG